LKQEAKIRTNVFVHDVSDIGYTKSTHVNLRMNFVQYDVSKKVFPSLNSFLQPILPG